MAAIWLIVLAAGAVAFFFVIQQRRRAVRRRHHVRETQNAMARANDAARLSQVQDLPRT